MTSIFITEQQSEKLLKYILDEDKKQQKYINKIKQEVNKYISEYCSPYIKDSLNTPIIKFRPFDGYNQSNGPVSHLYQSVANNRSGSFFVWDKQLNEWVNLGGPHGKDNPTEKKDKNGNVIAKYEYEYNIKNTFSTEEELKNSLPNGGEDGQGYLVNAQNKVIDFLRLNAFDQFSVTWNGGPLKYLPGAVRIACKDLGYYSFSEHEMRGGDICVLTKYVNLIYWMPEIMIPEGLQLDENLNGMDFNKFIRVFKPGYDKYVEMEYNKLKDEENSLTENGYEIYSIDDECYNTMFTPTALGRQELNKLAKYTDWCICTNMGEYAQYTQNGGKVYICAKKGFEKIKHPTNTKDDHYALDDYGLSLICVIVGRDGLPDNITTRYNHNFNGENHQDLRLASQLQKILGVKYRDVFVPRSEEELANAHMNESKSRKKIKKVNAGIMDAITGCGMYENTNVDEPTCYIGKGKNDEYYHMHEDKNTKENDESTSKKLKSRMHEIENFMYDNGLNVKPFPKIELRWEEQEGLFVPTGFYSPSDRLVTIFCNGRHPKDILRSFAHEMIHHSQNLNGIELNFTTNDDVKDNKRLEKIEAQAYKDGNVLFRKWTEYEKKKLNESLFVGEGLDADEVDLTSFEIKNKLNPKFWKDGRLDSRIRMKLLDIADDFIETLGIPWVETKDIIITGSIANYNWNNKYSDIDLHVVIDFDDVDERHDFVERYFKAQKNQWNSEHENLKICGFPVEVYVQDVHEEHTSTGEYSLENDEWIEIPDRNKMKSSKIDKDYIKNKVSKYATKIDKLYSSYINNSGDIERLENIKDKASKLFDKIKLERKNGLNGKDTEITNGNIIFKCLRRLEYLDKLSEIKSESYDIINSLNEEHGKQTVYLMIGLPGSGKSTWIEKNLPGVKVVSRDLIRSSDELGFCKNGEKMKGSKEQEDAVTKIEQQQISDLIDSKVDFVIDDTNLTAFYRTPLIDSLKKRGLTVVGVLMNTDLETCKKARDGQISSDIMDRINNKANFPNKDEFDKLIIIDRK